MNVVTVNAKLSVTKIAHMPLGGFAIDKEGNVYYRNHCGAICLNDIGKTFTGSMGDLSMCTTDRHDVTMIQPGSIIKIVVGQPEDE